MTNYLRAIIKNPSTAKYDGEDHDEEIYYVLRQSYITTIPWLLGTAILYAIPRYIGPFLSSFKTGDNPVFGLGFVFALTAFWYLFTTGFFIQNFLNWFFNVYIITNKKIVDVDFYGILYKNISETTLDNIEDVTSNVSGTIGIIFNIGHVFIQTAAERREFEFANVDDPSKIRDIISDLAAKRRHDVNN